MCSCPIKLLHLCSPARCLCFLNSSEKEFQKVTPFSKTFPCIVCCWSGLDGGLHCPPQSPVGPLRLLCIHELPGCMQKYAESTEDSVTIISGAQHKWASRRSTLRHSWCNAIRHFACSHTECFTTQLWCRGQVDRMTYLAHRLRYHAHEVTLDLRALRQQNSHYSWAGLTCLFI